MQGSIAITLDGCGACPRTKRHAPSEVGAEQKGVTMNTEKEYRIPGTPCLMIGTDYSEMRRIAFNLSDAHSYKEFYLKGLGSGKWQMMYKETR